MITEIGDFREKTHPKDLVLKRNLKAPRKLVFEALTKPEHLVHFWAPKPFTTHNCKVDLRPGGSWTYTFRSPEGQEHDCKAEYEAVEEPSRLVITQAVPGPGGKPFFRIRQTITLEDKGKETALVFEAKVLEANPGSEPFLGGMKQGTNGTLDNLEEYLSKMGKGK
ncbi:MAG TPA: SRPBCC domain-containing protein [bacterium]|nr:SRPBCC domain-containing protein [bacterium]